ncbi:MAG: hypothetical protein M0015_07640 [Betaproteobacteria bacterium]|nr:hypothetical protein [Betaproteobacteria bacterium]
MLQISALQLAELLSGIARAQAAIIHGIESAMPGTRSSHVVPALQNVSHMRDHPDPTLTDLPVRVLLAYMGRIGPDLESIARDLERLTAAQPAAAAPTSAAARAAADPARESRLSPDASGTLDFRDLHPQT